MNWPAVLRVAALTALLAPAAAVAEWVNFGVVSTTMGVNSNRLCVGENSTAFQTAFGCPSYAPYVDPATGNMGLGTTAPGTALAVSGTIGITRDGGGSNHQLDINGFDAYHSWYGGNLIFYGNGAERARIDTNGSMGIGTSSPAFALDVSGSIRAGTGSGDKGAAALVEGSGGNSGYVSFINPAGTRVGYMGYGYIGGTPLTLQTDGNTALAFSTNATERVRITSSGNVGIGTTAPQATLQVSGSFVVSTSAQSTTPSLYVGTNGNVGFGTSSPLSTSGYNWVTINGPEGGGGLLSLATNNVETLRLQNNGFASYIYGITNVPLIFTTNLVERLRIGADGNIGVSVTTPNAKLEVNGTISSTGISVTGIVTATYFEGDGSRLTGLGSATVASNTGAIQFKGAGGSLAGDTDNLYWDNGSKRLGIGTMTPSSKFEVSSSAIDALTITTNSNSTTDRPGLLLRHFGDGGGSTPDSARIGAVGFLGKGVDGSSLYAASLIDSYIGTNGATTASGDLRFYTNPGVGTAAQERVRIDSAGNVGIGTMNPQATLEVSGTVQIAGTTNSACGPGLYFTIRANPTTGAMEICRK